MHTSGSARVRFLAPKIAVTIAASILGGLPFGAAIASDAGRLSRVYNANVTLDGSHAPPGDAVTVTALVAKGADSAEIQISAFVVSGEGDKKQDPVKAKGDGFRGDGGEFVARSVLVTDGRAVAPPATKDSERPKESMKERSIGFKRTIAVPYAALDVPPGEHFLGYVATLVVDGETVDTLPLSLTRLTVSNRVRTTLVEIIPESKSELRTMTQDLLVMLDGKLQPRTHKFTEEVTFCEVKEATHQVRIPGEFLREHIYASSDPTPARDAFAPSDKRTIFFGTNRVEENRNGPARDRFGDTSIDPDAPVAFGAYQVSVPQIKHKRGQVNQPESTWLFWTEKPDPEKHFVILDRDPLSKPRLTLEEFSDRLGDHDTFLYVHGFNNTFEDAVVRAAQLQHDIRFGGNMMVFSWPSAGKTLFDVGLETLSPKIKLAYDHDKKEAEKSAPFLADTLIQVMKSVRRSHPDAKVHVVAHSMGNHLLLKALSAVHQSLGKEGLPNLRLGEVILAAPDVTGTDFLRHHQSLFESCERVTFYSASDDKALAASRLRNQDKPVGLVPLVIPNREMDTVLANGTTETFHAMGHSYFGDSGLLLTDMSLVVTLHKPPLERRPPLGRRIETDDRNGCFYFELGPEWLP